MKDFDTLCEAGADCLHVSWTSSDGGALWTCDGCGIERTEPERLDVHLGGVGFDTARMDQDLAELFETHGMTYLALRKRGGKERR